MYKIYLGERCYKNFFIENFTKINGTFFCKEEKFVRDK